MTVDDQISDRSIDFFGRRADFLKEFLGSQKISRAGRQAFEPAFNDVANPNTRDHIDALTDSVML